MNSAISCRQGVSSGPCILRLVAAAAVGALTFHGCGTGTGQQASLAAFPVASQELRAEALTAPPDVVWVANAEQWPKKLPSTVAVVRLDYQSALPDIDKKSVETSAAKWLTTTIEPLPAASESISDKNRLAAAELFGKLVEHRIVQSGFQPLLLPIRSRGTLVDLLKLASTDIVIVVEDFAIQAAGGGTVLAPTFTDFVVFDKERRPLLAGSGLRMRGFRAESVTSSGLGQTYTYRGDLFEGARILAAIEAIDEGPIALLQAAYMSADIKTRFSSIASETLTIAESGKYMDTREGQVTIANSSKVMVLFLIQGAVARRFVIEPGTELEITLAAGSYDLAVVPKGGTGTRASKGIEGGKGYRIQSS